MLKFTKTVATVAVAGALFTGLAACSSTSTDPVATLPTLSGVDTQVTLDKGFVDALSTLKLTAAVTGTATLTDGALHFPITGGKVTYYDPASSVRPYVQGEVDHAGSGITLTGGSTVVGLSDFKIDPGTSRLTGTVTANGKPVGTNVFIFNLDGNTLKPLTKDGSGNAVLEGTGVYVSSDAAALLNKTFNTDAVTSSLLVGIAKITAK